MKKKLLFLFALMGSVAALHAEFRVLTVDMGEIYNNYYRAQEAQSKFNSSVENAQEEIRKMIDEGRTMAEEFQELMAKANNPAYTEDAREKYGKQAEELQQQIRRKETEVNNFKQQADQQLAARRQSTLNLHLDEIKLAVKQVAQRQGADMVLNSNGLGIVYFQESSDITQSVLDILNADKP